MRATTTLAETQEKSLILDANGGQSFSILIQQAEKLARESITETFNENPELTEVTVIILARRQRQIVPILRTRVPRQQWRNKGNIEEWTRYLADARTLLFRVPSSRVATRPSPSSISRRASRRQVIEDDPGFRDD